jgi:hypothetical protein
MATRVFSAAMPATLAHLARAANPSDIALPRNHGAIMWMKWFPWRFLVSRFARAYGFADPIQWINRMRSFAATSEIGEPVELLRAGVLFHARGLINTKAIQHNLDWVWPYWVERQFNPADHSFIPRAFSFSHINLTHRNWTAVGLPDVPFYSIVDPRGLVTPFHDSWSLDFWLLDDECLFPSKLDWAEQRLETGGNLRVKSRFTKRNLRLETEVFMEIFDDEPHCVIRVRAEAPPEIFLAVAVRPFNPEGISFIDSIRIGADHREWFVNKNARILFDRAPAKCFLSRYREGDVGHVIESGVESNEVTCNVSMASGAALFSIRDLQTQPLEVRVPVLDEHTKKISRVKSPPPSWETEIAKCSRLKIPDPQFQKLYDAAVASLILHTPGEVFPGPYTYKRFWYRDAAFILNALISLGAHERTRRALDFFPRGQTMRGYFRSQEGEWDSNGEALWIMRRYLELTGEKTPDAWLGSIEKGARWISEKRLPKNLDAPHAGLLPAGFSAEHLGPNDFYYWDDFWGVAGLRAAAAMLNDAPAEVAKNFSDEAEDFLQSIIASFRFIPTRRNKGAIAASPYRRMDAGAIGSIVADYPLQLFPPGDSRVIKTVEYLLSNSSYAGGFFQNMIHSGINAYLTLHLAQVLLRAGDLRALQLADVVARLATPTGQWPEAIHPHTGGGCMGDGQHVWAAAEWAMMIRNCFVREENNRLVIGAGIFPRWLQKREAISFGPTLTPFGPVTLGLEPHSTGKFSVHIEAEWRGQPPQIEIRVPGYSQPAATQPQILIEAI